MSDQDEEIYCFDDDVVDAAAGEGAEDVLDRLNLRMAGLDRRGPHEIRDVVHAGLYRRGARQVDALEHDPVVGRRGLQNEGHLLPGVQGTALDGYRARQGPLFHKIMLDYECRQLVPGSASAESRRRLP